MVADTDKGVIAMKADNTNKKENIVMSVDAATVHDWIENNQALLVDVRETSEFEIGRAHV